MPARLKRCVWPMKEAHQEDGTERRRLQVKALFLYCPLASFCTCTSAHAHSVCQRRCSSRPACGVCAKGQHMRGSPLFSPPWAWLLALLLATCVRARVSQRLEPSVPRRCPRDHSRDRSCARSLCELARRRHRLDLGAEVAAHTTYASHSAAAYAGHGAGHGGRAAGRPRRQCEEQQCHRDRDSACVATPRPDGTGGFRSGYPGHPRPWQRLGAQWVGLSLCRATPSRQAPPPRRRRSRSQALPTRAPGRAAVPSVTWPGLKAAPQPGMILGSLEIHSSASSTKSTPTATWACVYTAT